MNAPEQFSDGQVSEDGKWRFDAAGNSWVPNADAATAPEQVQQVGGAPAPPPPPPAPETLPQPPAPSQVQAPPSEPQVMSEDWPCAGYTGPQPWEAENPPALTQSNVMLGAGSAGDAVVELAALLAHLGYGTNISSGKNPHAIFDRNIEDAVRSFCNDYGVTEDPQLRQARGDETVGPWLWEALTRAVHKKLAGAGEGEGA